MIKIRFIKINEENDVYLNIDCGVILIDRF